MSRPNDIQETRDFYTKQFRSFPRLTDKQWRKLWISARTNLAKRDELILRKLNLVLNTAFRIKLSNNFLYEDICSEGLIGLIDGIDKGLAKKKGFEGYLKLKILWAILDARPSYYTLSLNDRFVTTRNKWEDVFDKFRYKYGRIPTLQEMRKLTKFKKPIIRRILDSYHSIIPIEDIDIPVEELKTQHLDMDFILKFLEPNERFVVERIHGLNGIPMMQKQQVAKLLHMKKSQVWKLETVGMLKVKALSERFNIHD